MFRSVPPWRGLFIVLLFLVPCSTAQEIMVENVPISTELRQRYLSARLIETEYQPVFRGHGEVLVGRLLIPPGAQVASRTQLHRDGSFATAVYPGRKLVFYAHGYEALTINPNEGAEIAPSVREIGKRSFVAAPPERLREVTGTLELEGPAQEPPLRIKTELSITNHAYLYRDEGHRGGPLTVVARSLNRNSGDAFSFAGLSSIPYDLTFSAPGYITRRLPVDPEADGLIDLGAVVLSPAPVLTFTYVAQLDLDTFEGWAGLEALTQTITCDGDTRFVYTDARDQYRNQFYLRLKPGETGVEASFWALPCQFHDLGSESLASFLADRDWVAKLPKRGSSDRAVLQPGHVYLFRDQARATNCLFAVE